MADKKSTYKGKFNYHGEVHTLWTSAKSEADAKGKFMSTLCTMLHIDRRAVCGYYNGEKDNYKITCPRG